MTCSHIFYAVAGTANIGDREVSAVVGDFDASRSGIERIQCINMCSDGAWSTLAISNTPHSNHFELIGVDGLVGLNVDCTARIEGDVTSGGCISTGIDISASERHVTA